MIIKSYACSFPQKVAALFFVESSNEDYNNPTLEHVTQIAATLQLILGAYYEALALIDDATNLHAFSR
tara:strand:- start:5317 stop:5520 length:204 start_codon:yes stop_codon:yes gene_type:complete